MSNYTILEGLKKMKALADIGLLYNQNEFDRERYAEVRKICFDLLAEVTAQPLEALAQSFPTPVDYPTAKVDIRALVLSPGGEILMAKESADGRWSLPGGWADIGESPAEVAVKECREETGLTVIPKALLAVFDKRLHAHPPQPFYVYKLVFLCEAVTTELQKGFDVLDVGFFPIDALPDLSIDRIVKSQIDIVYQKAIANDWTAHIE